MFLSVVNLEKSGKHDLEKDSVQTLHLKVSKVKRKKKWQKI